MRFFLIALLLTIYANPNSAQNKSIVVLGGGNKSKITKKKNYPSMAVKVGALNFITGNLPICFEKEYKNFGLLVGAGPTFRRFLDNSFWSSLLDDEEVNYSWGSNQLLSNVYNPFGIGERPKFTYSPSYYFVVNPKYYYNEEGMDGGYFGVQLAMSQYSYKNQAYNSTIFSEAGRDRYTDILVQWGAQYGDNKFVFEWYNGLGIRFKDELRYAYAFDLNGDLLEGTAQIKRSSIRYELGMRVGFKF
jgi:hypothetical protein